MTDYFDRITISDDMGIYPTGDYAKLKNENLEIIRIEKFNRKDQIITIPDSIIQKSIITYIPQVWVNDLNQAIDCYKITIPNGDNYYVIRSDFPDTNRTEKIMRICLGDMKND